MQDRPDYREDTGLSPKAHDQAKVEQLLGLASGRKTALIMIQDNPDPDAIASAAGLARLLKRRSGVECTIAYGGVIGRSENRALVNCLGIDLLPAVRVELADYDLVATLDAQPGARNNALTAADKVDIVIDHHPRIKGARRPRFADIRTRCGATATIITQYLRAARVKLDSLLATALLYGIKSDTQDLGREATHADEEAFFYLYRLADKALLGKIEHEKVTRDYFAVLQQVMATARVYGDVLVASAGELDNPDWVAETADLLLRLEGIEWVMCFGRVGNNLHMSVRALDEEAHAGEVLREVVRSRTAAGGHATMAGGRVAVHGLKSGDRERLEERFTRRLLKIVGADVPYGKGEPLVHPREG